MYVSPITKHEYQKPKINKIDSLNKNVNFKGYNEILREAVRKAENIRTSDEALKIFNSLESALLNNKKEFINLAGPANIGGKTFFEKLLRYNIFGFRNKKIPISGLAMYKHAKLNHEVAFAYHGLKEFLFREATKDPNFEFIAFELKDISKGIASMQASSGCNKIILTFHDSSKKNSYVSCINRVSYSGIPSNENTYYDEFGNKKDLRSFFGFFGF